ncbi:MAG TPA: BON domain-containing protein [Tepidisphaeraceae bacterium]|nr:BON domain-containing protein [Tepidisphaeraceae bacterium]
MSHRGAIVAIALLPLILLGCNHTSLHKVHEAPLLNNKVLQQRVEAALRRAGSDFASVHVNANGGAVLLSGTVRSASVRAQAEKISRGVYGVDKIDNQLTLKKQPPFH